MGITLAIVGNISCCMSLLYLADYVASTGVKQFMRMTRKGGVWAPILLATVVTITGVYLYTWKVILG